MWQLCILCRYATYTLHFTFLARRTFIRTCGLKYNMTNVCVVWSTQVQRCASRHSDVHVVAWKYRKNCTYHNNNIYWRQLTRKQYGSIVPLRVFAAQNSSSKYLVSVYWKLNWITNPICGALRTECSIQKKLHINFAFVSLTNGSNTVAGAWHTARELYSHIHRLYEIVFGWIIWLSAINKINPVPSFQIDGMYVIGISLIAVFPVVFCFSVFEIP